MKPRPRFTLAFTFQCCVIDTLGLCPFLPNTRATSFQFLYRSRFEVSFGAFNVQGLILSAQLEASISGELLTRHPPHKRVVYVSVCHSHTTASPQTISMCSTSAALEKVQYDIPPQVFDYTQFLSEFTVEVAGGAFGTVYRAGLGSNGNKFLAVKVPRRFIFRTEQEFIKVEFDIFSSFQDTIVDCIVEFQLRDQLMGEDWLSPLRFTTFWCRVYEQMQCNTTALFPLRMAGQWRTPGLCQGYEKCRPLDYGLCDDVSIFFSTKVNS